MNVAKNPLPVPLLSVSSFRISWLPVETICLSFVLLSQRVIAGVLLP